MFQETEKCHILQNVQFAFFSLLLQKSVLWPAGEVSIQGFLCMGSFMFNLYFSDTMGLIY